MRTRSKTNGRWIVFERAPRWSSAICVACRETRRDRWLGRTIVAIGSEADCLDVLRRFPASFVTLEITPANFADRLDLTARLSREFPAARVTVVSSCGDGAEAWPVRELALREAGATIVARNVWQIDPLLSQAQRHLSSLDNRPDVPLTERIWSELPWESA